MPALPFAPWPAGGFSPGAAMGQRDGAEATGSAPGRRWCWLACRRVERPARAVLSGA